MFPEKVAEESIPTEPEAEAQEEPAAPEEPKEDTPDEVAALRARLEDKDSFIGRQSNELGELRRQVEELARVQQQQQHQRPLDEDEFDEIMDENPAQAVAVAVQTQDGLRFQKALKTWYEVDPYSATEYRLQMERQQQQEMVQQQQAQSQEYIQSQQLNQAYTMVKAKHPDFAQYEQAMAEAAKLAPHLLEPLKYGDPQSKERVIESLYLMGKGLSGPAPATPTEEPVPHVASATTSPDGDSGAKPIDPLLATAMRLVDEETFEP